MSIYLSASSIKDYLKCSQRVYYRLSKEVKEVQSPEMLIGNIVHSAIEKHWDDKEVASKSLVKSAKALKMPSFDIAIAGNYLENFFTYFRKFVGEEDRIEFNFKLPIYDDVFIVGKIDRIADGNVYDWKTGTIRSKKLSNDPQCIIYSYAYERLFGKKPKNVNLAALQTGELIPYVPSAMHEEELFSTIIPSMIKTIRNSTYSKIGLFNGGCFRCPYRIGCLKLGEENVLDNSITPE